MVVGLFYAIECCAQLLPEHFDRFNVLSEFFRTDLDILASQRLKDGSYPHKFQFISVSLSMCGNEKIRTKTFKFGATVTICMLDNICEEPQFIDFRL
jgi:hypothetical protein